LVREQHTVQSIFRERLTATRARCCATAAVAAFSLDAQRQPAGINPEVRRLL